MTEFKFLKAHGLGNDFVIFTEYSKLNISKNLVKFLSDKLAAFKIPALVKFMDSNLPLVASGKFDKPALREIFTQE